MKLVLTDIKERRKLRELEQVRLLAHSQNDAADQFLAEIVEKLKNGENLTRTETQYLAGALTEIREGKDARQALLLKKSAPGRARGEDYQQIVAELEMLRHLGKSLNKGRRQVAKKFRISVDTVNRARDAILAVDLREDPEARLTAEVTRTATETGGLLAACKAVARRYDTDWPLVCLHLNYWSSLRLLGAEAIQKGAAAANVIVDKRGLSSSELPDEAGELKSIQETIGRDYLVQCAQQRKQRQAEKLYQSVIIAEGASAESWMPRRYLLIGQRRFSRRLRDKIAIFIPGFAWPQGLRQNSYKKMSLCGVLVTFLLYSGDKEEAATQEQWRIAEEIRAQLLKEALAATERSMQAVLGKIGLDFGGAGGFGLRKIIHSAGLGVGMPSALINETGLRVQAELAQVSQQARRMEAEMAPYVADARRMEAEMAPYVAKVRRMEAEMAPYVAKVRRMASLGDNHERFR